MGEPKTQIQFFEKEADLKAVLASNYISQINNFFGDNKKALRFLSSVMADVQRNKKLLECTAPSLINAYITMAGLGFMPSGVSGEGYVLPYNVGGKMTAQFQLGYKGLVTLFYQAGVEKITAEIVRKNDKFSMVNGELKHEIDLTQSNEERGDAVGAYTRVTFRGETTTRYMNGKDILKHALKFSKSYNPTGQYSPWNPANDPELNMWRKTVLKQHEKLLPKNENINKAIAEDNKDSIIGDRLDAATEESKSLPMGNLLKNGDDKNKKEKGAVKDKGKDETENADSAEAEFERNEERENGERH
jgi:recombination protein RecT